MTPSNTMGTFLRVWRSEWAGLSRAQVAVAISAVAKRPIKPDIVRRWEEGQPPASAAELEALIAVMQRHGLLHREASHFRQAVFGACLDRQYPELFQAEGFAYHPDVDEAAHAAFERHWTAGGVDIVQLVGMADSLSRAVYHGGRSAVSSAQAQKQFVALCYLRALLAEAHDYGNRPGAAAASWAGDGEVLQLHFGRRGLGWPLTPLYARIREAYSRSYPSTGPSYPAGFGSPVWSVRLLGLAEEAEAQGDLRAGVVAFFYALGGLDHYRHPDLEAALSRASDYVEKAEATGDPDGVQQAHFELCITHTRHGPLEEAEKHLAATEFMRTGSPLRQAMWYCNLGRLRLAQGDPGGAQEALEQALRAARQTPERANWEDLILGLLALCERDELSARQRTLHPVEPPKSATRPRARSAKQKHKPPLR
jgi:hypothetical protein